MKYSSGLHSYVSILFCFFEKGLAICQNQAQKKKRTTIEQLSNGFTYFGCRFCDLFLSRSCAFSHSIQLSFNNFHMARSRMSLTNEIGYFKSTLKIIHHLHCTHDILMSVKCSQLLSFFSLYFVTLH